MIWSMNYYAVSRFPCKHRKLIWNIIFMHERKLKYDLGLYLNYFLLYPPGRVDRRKRRWNIIFLMKLFHAWHEKEKEIKPQDQCIVYILFRWILKWLYEKKRLAARNNLYNDQVSIYYLTVLVSWYGVVVKHSLELGNL